MFLYSEGRLFELTGATVRLHPCPGSGTPGKVAVVRGEQFAEIYRADTDEEAVEIVAEIARQINGCVRCGKVIDMAEVVAAVKGERR